MRNNDRIEIVFSDSACGSLKVALRRGKLSEWVYQRFVSHANGSNPPKEKLDAAQREAEKNVWHGKLLSPWAGIHRISMDLGLR